MKRHVKDMIDESFAVCENPECKGIGIPPRYCGDKKFKARLLVELPEELQEKLDKSHAWLCFKCVKKHCYDTIGTIRRERDGITPRFDEDGKVIRSDYWCELIFGKKRAKARYNLAG